MGEERGSERACGIHGSGMLNRNDESRGEEIRWVEKKKKRKKAFSACARVYHRCAPLWNRSCTRASSKSGYTHTHARALLIKNYRPSNS